MRFQFAGLKSTVINVLAQVALIALLIQTQIHWQDRLAQLNFGAYGLLLVTALLGAQFKRSRITFACVLSLSVLASTQLTFSLPNWLDLQPQWPLLFGASVLTLLSFSQDRGLFSIHSLIRVIAIALCGGLSFGWLWLIGHYHDTLVNLPVVSAVTNELVWPIPIALLLCATGYRAITANGLSQGALLTSSLLWLAVNQQWLDLPLSIVMLLLGVNYLLCILIESYFLAYRDDLTGLPTRRALNQLALSLGRKYTVAMLDIDHFKKFNDTYGHDIGDQVLKLVASKLTGVKAGGRVFRYGGEEFTLVFPGKTPDDAIAALDTLRQTIAEYQMVVRTAQRSNKKARGKSKSSDSKTVSVTVSIGVAQRQAKQSFDQCLKQADMALYRAKKAGRNTVCN